MITAVRQEFADALSAVEGLTGHAETPVVMAVGTAWSRWTGLEAQGTPGLFATAWQVLIITGGTPAQAETYLNEKLSDILDAIQPVAWVTSATPTQIDTPSGTLYGLAVTAVRE